MLLPSPKWAFACRRRRSGRSANVTADTRLSAADTADAVAAALPGFSAGGGVCRGCGDRGACGSSSGRDGRSAGVAAPDSVGVRSRRGVSSEATTRGATRGAGAADPSITRTEERRDVSAGRRWGAGGGGEGAGASRAKDDRIVKGQGGGETPLLGRRRVEERQKGECDDGDRL